ncbi:MAG TPA: glycosyltransferase [Sumerlaeia bacterium]|nr:glycosyltransferase [Sumerlaeia bacterium]
MAELAVVIPCLNEADNLEALLPRIASVVAELGVSSETFVVDGGSVDGSPEAAERLGAKVIVQKGAGYGGALRTAFERIDSRYLVTLDADFSHPPSILKYLYEMRDGADIVIASRRVQGGHARMPWTRRILSGVLNEAFRRVLSLPFRDMSSGYRLYRREILAGLDLKHSTYAVLQEILIKAYCAGYRIVEIPFHYLPRRSGQSHARLFRFGRDYLAVLWEMWKVRNSVASADYDTRAFRSRIPLQRWWQRQRYRIILEFIGDRLSVLDAGCGSTQILNGAPQAVGLDLQLSKLRFMRRPGRRLVNGNVLALPFRDATFGVVVCSEVVEHLPKDAEILQELIRVLRPGGSLILGTPDYGSWQWPLLEKTYDFVQPGGYAEQHITHYTRKQLAEKLRDLGLHVRACRTICGAELIFHARKPAPER